MITCDVDGISHTEAECAKKQAEAKKLHIFREKTGRPVKYDKCYACPEGIRCLNGGVSPAKPERKPEEPTMNTKNDTTSRNYMPGTCKVCGEKKNVFRNSQICGKCTQRKGAKPEPAAAIPEAKVVEIEMSAKSSATTITLEMPNDLMNRLIRRAVEDLRTPDAQALWIIREELRES